MILSIRSRLLHDGPAAYPCPCATKKILQVPLQRHKWLREKPFGDKRTHYRGATLARPHASTRSGKCAAPALARAQLPWMSDVARQHHQDSTLSETQVAAEGSSSSNQESDQPSPANQGRLDHAAPKEDTVRATTTTTPKTTGSQPRKSKKRRKVNHGTLYNTRDLS